MNRHINSCLNIICWSFLPKPKTGGLDRQRPRSLDDKPRLEKRTRTRLSEMSKRAQFPDPDAVIRVVVEANQGWIIFPELAPKVRHNGSVSVNKARWNSAVRRERFNMSEFTARMLF